LFIGQMVFDQKTWKLFIGSTTFGQKSFSQQTCHQITQYERDLTSL
jgi:hypothetical protein